VKRDAENLFIQLKILVGGAVLIGLFVGFGAGMGAVLNAFYSVVGL
jgi:hypothetical protein